jgi:hypothetical protein
MADSPGAMQLRLLQTVTDVTSEQNSTLVMPLPVELLRFFENSSGERTRSASADVPIPLSQPAAAPGQERSHTDGEEPGTRVVATDQEAGPR